MSFRDRALRAFDAFRAPDTKAPATRLRSMPTTEQMHAIRGNESYSMRKRGKKPFQRTPYHNRRWQPPDVEAALSQCDGSGQLRQAMELSAWVQADPIVHGIAKARIMIPHRPVGVKYSDEAAAWLEGTAQAPGMRTRIASPNELSVSAADEFFGGQQVGLLVWNAKKDHPEYEALDPAGLWYRQSEKRWQYHGYSQVFDVCEDEMILDECGQWVPNPWVFGGLSKNAPWYQGLWHKIAYKTMQAQLAAELRDIWQNAFSMPIIVARTPQGASDLQKARFTESILGAFLRVVGVTPGYDVEMKQATAEGAGVFTQAESNLERAVAIAVWGTVGLLAGGAGFANSDMFEQMAADIISAAARHISQRENEQIWRKVLKWANARGYISNQATNACIEYQTESAAVIERKAKAAKALMDTGYTPEEAHHRVGLERAAMPEATPSSAAQPVVQAPSNASNLPEAREDEEPEPTYSEGIAAALNERNEAVCPCPNHADRHCPRCGVVRRQEVKDGQWVDAWHATRRRAA